MKITDIEYFRLEMPLAIPYTIAYETVDKTVNIILKLVTDGGIVGWGCAAPDISVTGETPEEVLANIETIIIGMLRNQSPFQIARINEDLKKQITGSSSVAMVDMALHDILARRANLPLYKILGGYREAIPTSITVGIMPLEETVERAKHYLKKGFTIIKLKGGTSLPEDVEKILILREKLGHHFLLRFDANQGYTAEESIEFVNKTKRAGIEIFEQPTSQHTEEILGQVTRNVEMAIMADESMKTLSDAFRLASDGVIDMVNIKLMKVGGILESQHINSVAKAAGLEVMVGCLDECALGISAGLHFALSRPNIEFADLDGHLDLLDDPFSDLFQLKNGILYPSDYPGLGNVRL